MKGCLQGCLTFFALLIISSVLLGFLGWKYVKKQFLTAPSTAPIITTLEVDSGTVTKNGSPAKTGDPLANGDKIHTAKNSAATLTFPDNSVLRLDENTDISVSQASSLKISIFQSLGRTWSRVVKLVDSNHSYEIVTPTAVATVRGTAFATNVNLDESTNIDTGSGTDLTKDQKKLFKRAIREELKNSPWYQNNRRRDREVLDKLSKSGASASDIISVIRTVSPDDLAKIQRVVQKAQSGKLNLTPAQQAQLEPLAAKFEASGGKLDPSMAPDAAAALAIIFPEDFSDTAHWTAVIRALIPFISKLQLLRLDSTE